MKEKINQMIDETKMRLKQLDKYEQFLIDTKIEIQNERLKRTTRFYPYTH